MGKVCIVPIAYDLNEIVREKVADLLLSLYFGKFDLLLTGIQSRPP